MMRPIDRWDGEETPDRSRSPFSATYSSTLALLDRELNMIEAGNVVLMCDVRESDVRVDGQLKERAVVRSPKIILAFDSKHGPLKYGCDAFSHWQANLRAIALGLEALRRVERYGIAGRGEQYTGWKALGSGIVTGEPLSRTEAVKIVIDLTRLPDVGETYAPNDLDDAGSPGAFLEDAFRAGARLHHPDRGGNEPAFKALVEAVDVLRETT